MVASVHFSSFQAKPTLPLLLGRSREEIFLPQDGLLALMLSPRTPSHGPKPRRKVMWGLRRKSQRQASVILGSVHSGTRTFSSWALHLSRTTQAQCPPESSTYGACGSDPSWNNATNQPLKILLTGAAQSQTINLKMK